MRNVLNIYCAKNMRDVCNVYDVIGIRDVVMFTVTKSMSDVAIVCCFT